MEAMRERGFYLFVSRYSLHFMRPEDAGHSECKDVRFLDDLSNFVRAVALASLAALGVDVEEQE